MKEKITQERLLQSALAVFSQKGYEGASMNDIRMHANCSKGILYHYFENKDELYLRCLEETIQVFLMQSKNMDMSSVKISDFISLRAQFQDKNDFYAQLFQYVVLEKPLHLQSRIKQIKKPLADFNQLMYESLIKDISFGQQVLKEDAYMFFQLYQNFTPLMLERESPDYDQLIRLLQIFINGLSHDLERISK